MIHLEPGHRIVAETIQNQLDSNTRYAVDVSAADHNDVMYKVFSDLDSKQLVTVSVHVPCFEEVAAQVGLAFFQNRYGTMLQPKAESGYSLTLTIDLDMLAASPEPRQQEVLQLMSTLRRDIEGAPLWVCFAALLHARPVPKPFYVVHARQNEPVYVVPTSDRVVVVFALEFDDPTEHALAAIFLQEIEVVRRQERSLATAPLISYSTKPPKEVLSLSLPSQPPATLGYLSMAVDKRHLEGEGRLEKAVGLVASYRSYVLYHVKCTKSNMHSRMRARVNSWLQVLNRAVPDKPIAEKKTVSGRTFKRAGQPVSSAGHVTG